MHFSLVDPNWLGLVLYVGIVGTAAVVVRLLTASWITWLLIVALVPLVPAALISWNTQSGVFLIFMVTLHLLLSMWAIGVGLVSQDSGVFMENAVFLYGIIFATLYISHLFDFSLS